MQDICRFAMDPFKSRVLADLIASVCEFIAPNPSGILLIGARHIPANVVVSCFVWANPTSSRPDCRRLSFSENGSPFLILTLISWEHHSNLFDCESPLVFTFS